MTDNEFYTQLDHCIQCGTKCDEEQLRAYLAVCYNCHVQDLMSDDEDPRSPL